MERFRNNLPGRLAVELALVAIAVQAILFRWAPRVPYSQPYVFTLLGLCIASFVLGAIAYHRGARFWGLVAMIGGIVAIIWPA